LAFCDINRTWEGDNYILSQQAAKLILKNVKYLVEGKPLHKCCNFFSLDPVEPLKSFDKNLSNSLDLINLLEY